MADEPLLDHGDAMTFSRQHQGATHADYAPANDRNITRFSHAGTPDRIKPQPSPWRLDRL
ncbi:hypothetical protein ACNJYA_08795 [Bradyrhizobium sp. DASA03068]|uniref:hypothetical protein n=1 Tax=Bradyrhizobium sp. BLXBL-01 TaxID=3395915 RepID=UPI003F729735